MARKVLVAAVVAAVSVAMCAVFGCDPGVSDAKAMILAQQSLERQAGSSPMPGEFSDGVKEIIQLMKDQGVLDKFLANCRAHGVNPGLKIEKGVVTYFKVGLDGFDADIEVRAEGTGTQLPTGFRLALLDQLKALEGRTDQDAIILRDKLLELLTWNRIDSPHNPVPR